MKNLKKRIYSPSEYQGYCAYHWSQYTYEKIMSKRALIIIDCINEMLHPDGKLSQKGYRNFLEQHQSITHINKVIADARANNSLVVFISLGFHENYADCPLSSPLFQNAPKFGILKRWTWSTNIYEEVNHKDNDISIHKNRVSAFHHTELDNILKEHGVTHILLAGCATDLAINSTARDAHDRDYSVTILSSCCIAANNEDHDNSLRLLGKITEIL